MLETKTSGKKKYESPTAEHFALAHRDVITTSDNDVLKVSDKTDGWSFMEVTES